MITKDMFSSAAISENLGRNIETLRKSRGLSQEKLASAARVPRSTLTHIESGNGNPSLSNLLKISEALQVSLEELLKKPRAECEHIRAKDVPFKSKSHGAVTVYKLLPDSLGGMEIDRMEFKPHARLGGVPHLAGTKEYFSPLRGRIVVTVSGEKYELSPGDVLAFPGDAHHSYRNVSSDKAICVSVVVPGAAWSESK